MLRRVLLTIRAIVTGVLATYLFRAVVILPIAFGARALGSRHWFAQWLFASILPGLLPAAGSAFAGWVVGRFHREHRVQMVVSYAVFVVLLALPRAVALAVNASSDPRFLYSLLTYLTNISVITIGTLVGGLWFAAPPDDPHGVRLTPAANPPGRES